MQHHVALHKELLKGEAWRWKLPDSGPHRPTWFNAKRFRRGQRFFYSHFIACLQSFFFAIICGFNVRRLAIPLLLTKRSDTPDKAVHRYLETIRYLMLWFHEDVFEPGSQAQISLSRVNRLHAAAAEMMRHHQADYPGLYFTQYDMSLVQYGFINVVVLYAADMGIRCDAQDLLGYVHFWRVIGYALGMEPAWNLCTNEKLDVVAAKCKAIEAVVAVPAVLELPADYQLLADVFIEGFHAYIPFFPFTKASIILFTLGVIAKHADYPVPRAPARLKITWKDRVYCLMYRITFALRYYFPRWLSNAWNKRMVNLSIHQFGLATSFQGSGESLLCVMCAAAAKSCFEAKLYYQGLIVLVTLMRDLKCTECTSQPVRVCVLH